MYLQAHNILRNKECDDDDQSFYRATRMHSADYIVARCLSVRLSVFIGLSISVRHSLVLCLNDYKYPQSFFSPSGSSTTLVFPHQTVWQYSDGNPLNECNGGYEKSRVSTNISLYLANDAR